MGGAVEGEVGGAGDTANGPALSEVEVIHKSTALTALLLLLAAPGTASEGAEAPSAPERNEISAAALQYLTSRTPLVDKNDDFIEDALQRASHQIMLFTPRHVRQSIPYGSARRPHLYLVRPPATAGDSTTIIFMCRDAATLTVNAPELEPDGALPLRRSTPSTGVFVLPPRSLAESPIHLVIATGVGHWEAFVHLRPPRSGSSLSQ